MELKENFHHGKYYILNRKELLSFFLKQKRIVNIAYIKEELLKNGFFEKIHGDEQPVLWQVFNNFKTPNISDKNIFKFRIFIEKKISIFWNIICKFF